MTTQLTHDLLLNACHDQADPVALALAGVLAAAARGAIKPPNPALGLDGARFQTLLTRYFPALDQQICAEHCAGCHPWGSNPSSDEFDDLVALLMAHSTYDGEEAEWLAHAIASACMGDGHLYHDMGLPNRQALSDLLSQHFTSLYEKNVGNMKWKKFFYKQLCDQAEVKVCQAPSCQVCVDFHVCFGPEDDSFPPSLIALAGGAKK
jgi:nitrogen fixation protein NifQ